VNGKPNYSISQFPDSHQNYHPSIPLLDFVLKNTSDDFAIVSDEAWCSEDTSHPYRLDVEALIQAHEDTLFSGRAVRRPSLGVESTGDTNAFISWLQVGDDGTASDLPLPSPQVGELSMPTSSLPPAPVSPSPRYTQASSPLSDVTGILDVLDSDECLPLVPVYPSASESNYFCNVARVYTSASDYFCNVMPICPFPLSELASPPPHYTQALIPSYDLMCVPRRPSMTRRRASCSRYRNAGCEGATYPPKIHGCLGDPGSARGKGRFKETAFCAAEAYDSEEFTPYNQEFTSYNHRELHTKSDEGDIPIHCQFCRHRFDGEQDRRRCEEIRQEMQRLDTERQEEDRPEEDRPEENRPEEERQEEEQSDSRTINAVKLNK